MGCLMEFKDVWTDNYFSKIYGHQSWYMRVYNKFVHSKENSDMCVVLCAVVCTFVEATASSTSEQKEWWKKKRWYQYVNEGTNKHTGTRACTCTHKNKSKQRAGGRLAGFRFPFWVRVPPPLALARLHWFFGWLLAWTGSYHYRTYDGLQEESGEERAAVRSQHPYCCCSRCLCPHVTCYTYTSTCVDCNNVVWDMLSADETKPAYLHL